MALKGASKPILNMVLAQAALYNGDRPQLTVSMLLSETQPDCAYDLSEQFFSDTPCYRPSAS